MELDQEDTDNKSLVETATEMMTEAGELMDGIPKPLKKGFLAAAEQLGTAFLQGLSIEIKAHSEGKAIETKAKHEAKALLLMDAAKKIAESEGVPEEYSALAMENSARKIVGKRLNLDKILLKTKAILQKSEVPDTETPQPEISPDWLNSYEDIAENMSSEEMQIRFAKILAGEIKKPSSFSIKSVKTLSEIDTQTANLFAQFCSYCMVKKIPIKGRSDFILEGRLTAIDGQLGSNSMSKFGLSYTQLLSLQEYGLISSELNSYSTYQDTIVSPGEKTVFMPFYYQDSPYCLRQQEDNSGQKKDFKITGVLLTTVGKQLYNIVDFIPNDKHFEALKEYFLKQKLVIEPVKTSD